LARKRFEPFFKTFNSCGLTRIREWTVIDKKEYRQALAAALGVEGE